MIIQPQGKYADLTFRPFAETNGVARLDMSMAPSAGGAATDPDFVFLGGDADATDWTTASYPVSPVACARQAVGVQPDYNQGSPCLGSTDDSVCFNESDYYLAPNNTFGQITTEDFVFEVVFKTGELAATQYLAGTRQAGVGWWLATLGADTFRLQFEDASGDVSITSAGLDAHSWHHAMIFVDRTGSTRWYVNGALTGGLVDVSGKALTIDGSNAMCLGSRAGGNTPFDSNIAYLAMWKRAGWLTSYQNDATVAERFGKVCGHWPQVANGTAKPNTHTRAFAAYAEKVESGSRKLYSVGGEWLRFVQREDANGEIVNGYLAEPQAEQLYERSQDLSHGDWDDERIDSITVDGSAGPGPGLLMDGVVGDSDDDTHIINQEITLTNAVHSMSSWAKKGDKNWLWFWDEEDNEDCYFDLNTPAVGTASAGTAYIEDWGDDIVRCIWVWTPTANDHKMHIGPAHADGDNDFAGDDTTVNVWLWNPQIEIGDYATSGILTAGAAATRLKDQLQFKGDDGSLGGVGSEERGTIEFDLLMPSFDIVDAVWLLTVSDGGVADDRIELFVTSDDKVSVRVFSATALLVDITGNVVVTDNERHTVRLTWTTNDVRLMVDGALEGQDTACTIPDDLDEIDIGSSRTATAQPSCLLSDIKVWSRNKVR